LFAGPVFAPPKQIHSRLCVAGTTAGSRYTRERTNVFQVKICGVTNVPDARLVAASGADAIGLNFYSNSQRYLTVDRAERIIRALPDGIQRVGLFVNATDDEVCRVYDQLGLDLIQLHGDESPEFLLSLGGRPVMRAFRMGARGVAPIVSYLDQCRAPGVDLRAVLIDAYHPHQYGGTGRTTDWATLQDQRDQLGEIPLVLAGGLTPENVAEAVHIVAPDAVDTASGVESAPGVKHPDKVPSFVDAAKTALNGI
jgi:phosphoribosylanthranilate isomerase